MKGYCYRTTPKHYRFGEGRPDGNRPITERPVSFESPHRVVTGPSQYISLRSTGSLLSTLYDYTTSTGHFVFGGWVNSSLLVGVVVSPLLLLPGESWF